MLIGGESGESNDPVPGQLLSDRSIKDSYLESVENVDTGLLAESGKTPLLSEMGEEGER